jgi:hypothetical protein
MPHHKKLLLSARSPSLQREFITWRENLARGKKGQYGASRGNTLNQTKETELPLRGSAQAPGLKAIRLIDIPVFMP